MNLTRSTIGGTVLLMLTHLLPAPAQTTYYPPVKQDLAAQTFPVSTAQTGVLNTGTDLIRLSPTEVLQAMVWDNGSGVVTLSTVINSSSNKAAFTVNPPTSPRPYTSVSNPDVAMAYYNGQLYADVVYLASYQVPTGTTTTTNTRAFFDSYRWNSATKQFDASTRVRQPLGVETVSNLPGFNGPPDIPRLHSSPNIDANANGQVGIVWQEKSTETAQVTILSPSYSGTSNPPYPNGYTYLMEGLVFADSYVLPATADGTGYLGCSNWRGNLISMPKLYNPNPTPTSNNPPIFNTQTLLPDVAVCADGYLWVSYLVSSATQGEPPVTAGLNLVVRKVFFKGCDLVDTSLSKAWQEGVTLNPPRLATGPDLAGANDVEVVQAWAGGACEEGYGSRSYYEIHNWGGSGGVFRPDFNLVSQVQVKGINGLRATEPVVAFYGTDASTPLNGDYVVAWTGLNYPANASEADVWSRSLKAGVPQAPGYSRVNYASPDNTKPVGAQRTPSVAARFSGAKNGVAFAWADEPTSTVRYRYSTLPAGSGQLNRPAAGGPTGDTGSAAPARRLEAFPNPFGSSVEFRVRLQPGEAVQSIQVTDLSGRVLDTVPTAAGAASTSEYTPPPYIHLEPTAGLAGRLVPGAPRHEPAQRNPAAEQKLAGPPRRRCCRVNRVS